MSTNSQNSGPGGVRNLRAMFETKPTDPSTSTSPPSRGRSPAGSEASIHSRPISKVRANFVAVERPNEAGQGQQWGLRKASDVGVMSETNTGNANGNPVLLNAHGQNESDSVPISSQTNGTDVRGADQDTEKQGADEVSKPPSPASKPDETIAAGDSTAAEIGGGLGAILKGSAFETSVPEPPAPVSTAGPKSISISNPSTKSKPALKATTLGTKMEEASKNTHPSAPPKGDFVANKNAISTKPPGGRIHPKISTKAPTTLISPSQKTPVSPNAPKVTPKGSPRQPTTSSGPTKKATITAQKSPTEPKSARTSLASAVTKPPRETRANASNDVPKSNGIKKEAAPTSPSISKPRPRSPTRPVRLPAAATAPTSAWAAKKSDEITQPSGRASLSTTMAAKKPFSASHSKPTAKAPSTTTSSLTKKPSRASLVSQSGVHDRSASRASTTNKAPAEGFLARMTRPTASFAQKTHEKLQVHSPPRERKSLAKPSTRKSLSKSEDGKVDDAETNGGDSHPVPDTATAADSGPIQRDEAAAQPLAAGQDTATDGKE